MSHCRMYGRCSCSTQALELAMDQSRGLGHRAIYHTTLRHWRQHENHHEPLPKQITNDPFSLVSLAFVTTGLSAWNQMFQENNLLILVQMLQSQTVMPQDTKEIPGFRVVKNTRDQVDRENILHQSGVSLFCKKTNN